MTTCASFVQFSAPFTLGLILLEELMHPSSGENRLQRQNIECGNNAESTENERERKKDPVQCIGGCGLIPYNVGQNWTIARRLKKRLKTG